MDMDRYFSGEALYGDDFSEVDIAKWHADEKEAYARLYQEHQGPYPYHALNMTHGYRHLAGRRFKHAIGFGAATGVELAPLRDRIDRITIVDPSESFNEPVYRVSPGPFGDLPLPDRSADLITCFGVLHHIPNVTFVIRELSRVLDEGGYLLVREPVVSMGDWRQPRRGLTKHERGIPAHILDEIVAKDFNVINRQFCMHPLTAKLFRDPFGRHLPTRADALLSNLCAWNDTYHPRSTLQKMRAACLFLTLRKR